VSKINARLLIFALNNKKLNDIKVWYGVARQG
jgi:hypothetical protein